MSVLSYIVPRVIYKTGSRYNRKIWVVEEAGKNKLLVNGARESGPYIEGLWRYALRELLVDSSRLVQNILVLGVAGGTVIHLLHALYPRSRILGVDIDPVIIDVGHTYFGLNTVPHLECKAKDAKEFVASYSGPMFDLVVVDIFVGPDVPDFVFSPMFERRVKDILSKDGFVLVNYLREPGYEKKAEKLGRLLKKLYPSLRSADKYNNRFFLAE